MLSHLQAFLTFHEIHKNYFLKSHIIRSILTKIVFFKKSLKKSFSRTLMYPKNDVFRTKKSSHFF